MNIIADWKEVLTKSYSVIMQYGAIVMVILDQMVPVLGDAIPGWVVIGYLAATIYARIVDQGLKA